MTPPSSVESFESIVETLVRGGYVPGLVLGVSRGGERLVHGVGEGAPDGRTIYETGSVGKVFTALLLAEARERGEVTLDQAIDTIAPDLSRLWGSAEPIRLWHLAAHVSGLPREPDNLFVEQENPYGGYGEDRLLDALERVELRSTPGQDYEYSNLGAGLLGLLLERVAGLSYEALVQSRIAAPLQLVDTKTRLSPEQVRRLAPPTAIGIPTVSWPADDALAASGCLRSTVADTLTFLEAHKRPADSPLCAGIRAVTSVRHGFGEEGGVGLAWHLTTDGVGWHNGSTGGYHAFVAFHADEDWALALLANDSCPEVTPVGFQLIDQIRGTPTPGPELWIPEQVSATELRVLGGRYEAPEGAVGIEVREVEGALRARLDGQPEFRLFPESARAFRYRVVEARVQFDGRLLEVPRTLTLIQDGRETVFDRRQG